MKKIVALLSIFVASGINAQIVFESYEDYYRNTFQSVFSAEKGVELKAEFVGANGDMQLSGITTKNRERLVVNISHGVILLNSSRFKLSHARPFKDEKISSEDFGRITKVYSSSNAACLESMPNSASGSAVRHKAVYLIAPLKKSVAGTFIKLPSLFASCLAVSKDGAGNFRFPAASYRYAANELDAEGVDFQIFAYKSRTFVATNVRKAIRFVEKENLYKFIESDSSSLNVPVAVSSKSKAPEAQSEEGI